jgi:hypothetical protein
MAAYGRQDDEWDALVHAGKAFLQERAILGRDTSYTEMSVSLARRTHRPPFDFSQQVERAGMGYLLGRIVEETYGHVGAMLSSIVIYLDANDAGPGFYKLAQEMGALPPGATKLAREEFWIKQTKAVYRFFAEGGRLDP